MLHRLLEVLLNASESLIVKDDIRSRSLTAKSQRVLLYFPQRAYQEQNGTSPYA
jgi:hypothetical protein